MIMKRTTFLIPAYNEERTIGKLVEQIKDLYPKSGILVIDNNSTDNTNKLAKINNTKVVFVKKQGKGSAMKRAFHECKTEFGIMLDADLTYSPSDAIKLVSEATKNKANIVVGSRLNGIRNNGSMSVLRLIGNTFFTILARILYKTQLSDICSGYWVIDRKARKIFKNTIKANGFEIEAEMTILAIKNKLKVVEVPIHYKRRLDSSASKLNSIRDGIKISITLFRGKLPNNNI